MLCYIKLNDKLLLGASGHASIITSMIDIKLNK